MAPPHSSFQAIFPGLSISLSLCQCEYTILRNNIFPQMHQIVSRLTKYENPSKIDVEFISKAFDLRSCFED